VRLAGGELSRQALTTAIFFPRQQQQQRKNLYHLNISCESDTVFVQSRSISNE
jgi:hypothetical protein